MLTLTVLQFAGNLSQHERAAPIMKVLGCHSSRPTSFDTVICTVGCREYCADDRRPDRLSLSGYSSKIHMCILEASRTVRCFVAAWYGPCLNVLDANQNDERAWPAETSSEATDPAAPLLTLL